MRWKLTTIFSALLAIASISNASAKAENQCASSITEVEMYECLNSELERADSALNSAYKNLMVRHKENGAPSGLKIKTQDNYLRKSQLAWIKLRDTTCDFETYESITGSGFGTIHTACLLKQTQKRVDYLKWFLQNP
jgi:uncharacterized protein YecT (DUF1311 family)